MPEEAIYALTRLKCKETFQRSGLCARTCPGTSGVKLIFHGTDTDTDTDTDFLADFRARILARKLAAARHARRVQLATSRTRTTILADLSVDFCSTRALFLARMSVGDARVYNT